MTLAVPDTVLGVSSSITFEITTDMIAQFARLTGDKNSLHVDEAFARRSAYRRPISHGMLPIAFLSLARPFQMGDVMCVPVAVDAQFLAPVYAGDRLRLSTGPARLKAETSEVEIPYEITHATSQVTVTRGVAGVVYERREKRAQVGTEAPGAMLPRPLEVSHHRFEDIQVGTTDVTEFAVTGASIRDLATLLASGAQGDAVSAADLSDACHLPNLLTLLLFSTSIGVRMPGASATFLEFSARFASPLALETAYQLQGTVTHRSRATQIIRKEMLVMPRGREQEVVLRGKASTLVAKPFRAMPSMDELKAAWEDRGLTGRVVIVTGASRGIGETTAKLLAVCGAKVVVNYHRGADDARRVVDEIVTHGGDAVAIAADVSNQDQVRSLVQQTRVQYGAVDVLVNNAARDFRPIAFATLTWDDIQQDLDVIAKGAFLCCQEVVPLMLAHGGGKIINISSVATDNPPPDQMKYVMAKSALVGLTRSLAAELAPRNIQVNLVVPNFVETDFVAHIQDGFRRKIAQDTPMRRLASPIDVARAVVFFASSHSSFTTGQKLMVTGGGAPYL